MDCFQTTRWDLVRNAACPDDPESREALEALCRTYWQPLVVFVRRSGYPEDDARDIVQGFFETFLSRNAVRIANPGRGRFRTFLLVCLKHHIADRRAAERAQRRGGRFFFVSLDEIGEPESESVESPGRSFDRAWAVATLGIALDRLHSEFVEAGRSNEYETLKPFLTANLEAGVHARLGKQLGRSINATTVALHRFRRRYFEIVRQVVGETVADTASRDDELRYLLELVAGEGAPAAVP